MSAFEAVHFGQALGALCSELLLRLYHIIISKQIKILNDKAVSFFLKALRLTEHSLY